MPTPAKSQPKPQQATYVLPVAIFLFGIVLAIAATFHVLIFLQERAGAAFDEQIAQNEQETAAILTADVQKYLDAKAAVKGIDPNRIPFSQVLERLVRVLPESVLVSSLAIDTQNKLTVNLVTGDYPSVANAATAIRKDTLFSSAFIPNASSATSTDRGTVVNFPIVVELNLEAGAVAAPARRVPSATTTPSAVPSGAPSIAPAATVVPTPDAAAVTPAPSATVSPL